jgi:hypothetical protein
MLPDDFVVKSQEVIDSNGKTCLLPDMPVYGVGISRVIASQLSGNLLGCCRGPKGPAPKIEAAKCIDVISRHQASKTHFITEDDGCPHGEGFQSASGFGEDQVEPG